MVKRSALRIVSFLHFSDFRIEEHPPMTEQELQQAGRNAGGEYPCIVELRNKIRVAGDKVILDAFRRERE